MRNSRNRNNKCPKNLTSRKRYGNIVYYARTLFGIQESVQKALTKTKIDEQSILYQKINMATNSKLPHILKIVTKIFLIGLLIQFFLQTFVTYRLGLD